MQDSKDATVQSLQQADQDRKKPKKVNYCWCDQVCLITTAHFVFPYKLAFFFSICAVDFLFALNIKLEEENNSSVMSCFRGYRENKCRDVYETHPCVYPFLSI